MCHACQDGDRDDLVANQIKSNKQDGLQVVMVEGKGRGVVTSVPFKKGRYVCHYSGELLSRAEGAHREKQYSEDVGCYIFFFTHKGMDMW